MKRSVGLVILTEISISDPRPQRGTFMAVLQRRGTWNVEKMKSESYPGCLQVTCHGKVEEGETFYSALIRESCEELGEAFTRKCQKDVPLVKLVHHTDDEKEVITYGAFVPPEYLRMIRLGPDSGGLDLVPLDEVDEIQELTPDFKEKGPEFRHTRVMFADEIVTVRNVFEIIQPTVM